MSGGPTGTSSKPKVESAKPSETSFKRKRGMFQKDLQHMMYGYGDEFNPLPESVALVEDIVVEYVTDLVHKAQDISSKRGKLLTEDFLFLMRKLLGSAVDHHHPLFHLAVRGRDLISRNWCIQFRHIFREANYLADFLANFAFSFPVGRHLLGDPPDGAVCHIVADSLGRATPRLVTH